MRSVAETQLGIVAGDTEATEIDLQAATLAAKTYAEE